MERQNVQQQRGKDQRPQRPGASNPRRPNQR
ncbi:protein ScvA [Coxiella burnetii]|uniref:Protein ScvA n=3 Tax=Coxiella burnetii TaxID=777 RepID=SCVA_COXBU|nr:protein ScvA [Coxiella burnetii]YP_002332993.1 small cell variant protein ScvA [Coxiella burnetii RSA 493]Q45966.1 RecName: Full=Protein ScvA; AltName: Full=Small-cell-variant protein A; Short=SCV protein A [Coxiella burnetii RSA 493]AAB39278.1 scvA [Coxiella burnetii]ACI15284.1 ScvA [Coxiella burnetii RSA 493]ACI23165.1 ScvA [Coxiella burnetii Dugway 5J108-111]ACJ18140.1 ScvA [Coxiella burnetii CbuG_Q212]ACJ20324.1 ScvA [Coxiella burnetii CbuK_Q154]